MRTRPRITWLIAGAIIVLLVVAGVDALRSSRGETSAPAAPTKIISILTAPTETSVSPTPTAIQTAPTDTSVSATPTVPPPLPPTQVAAQGGTPRHVKYARAALAVCAAASSELFRRANPNLLQSEGWTGGRFSLEEMANIWEWNRVAAEMQTRSLRRLEALAAPPAERKLISEFFRAAEDERDLLREVAGAAAGDHAELLQTLGTKRVDATHRKDGVVARISARWHLDPEPLQACPLMLPA